MKENQITLSDYVMSQQHLEMPTDLVGVLNHLNVLQFRFYALHEETCKCLGNIDNTLGTMYQSGYEEEAFDIVNSAVLAISLTSQCIMSFYATNISESPTQH